MLVHRNCGFPRNRASLRNVFKESLTLFSNRTLHGTIENSCRYRRLGGRIWETVLLLTFLDDAPTQNETRMQLPGVLEGSIRSESNRFSRRLASQEASSLGARWHPRVIHRDKSVMRGWKRPHLLRGTGGRNARLKKSRRAYTTVSRSLLGNKCGSCYPRVYTCTVYLMVSFCRTIACDI